MLLLLQAYYLLWRNVLQDSETAAGQRCVTEGVFISSKWTVSPHGELPHKPGANHSNHLSFYLPDYSAFPTIRALGSAIAEFSSATKYSFPLSRTISALLLVTGENGGYPLLKCLIAGQLETPPVVSSFPSLPFLSFLSLLSLPRLPPVPSPFA